LPFLLVCRVFSASYAASFNLRTDNVAAKII